MDGIENEHVSKTLSREQVKILSKEVKQSLVGLYGDRLDQVILYGSYARGDFHANSDIDFLVVLRDEEVKGGLEVRRMSSVIGDISLKYVTEVSILPVSAGKYRAGKTSLYRSASQEGQQI